MRAEAIGVESAETHLLSDSRLDHSCTVQSISGIGPFSSFAVQGRAKEPKKTLMCREILH